MQPLYPPDLVPLRAACHLVPSSVPGKCVCCSTLYRWAQQGLICLYRLGGRTFVSRSELAKLLRVERQEPPALY